MLTIGTLAKKTGTKVQTIRYYEQIGLLPEPGRSAGGQRRYGDSELDRLSFVRHARQLGFSLDAIRELLDLSDHPDKSCAEADAIAKLSHHNPGLLADNSSRLSNVWPDLKPFGQNCRGWCMNAAAGTRPIAVCWRCCATIPSA